MTKTLFSGNPVSPEVRWGLWERFAGMYSPHCMRKSNINVDAVADLLCLLHNLLNISQPLTSDLMRGTNMNSPPRASHVFYCRVLENILTAWLSAFTNTGNLIRNYYEEADLALDNNPPCCGVQGFRGHPSFFFFFLHWELFVQVAAANAL